MSSVTTQARDEIRAPKQVAEADSESFDGIVFERRPEPAVADELNRLIREHEEVFKGSGYEVRSDAINGQFESKQSSVYADVLLTTGPGIKITSMAVRYFAVGVLDDADTHTQVTAYRTVVSDGKNYERSILIERADQNDVALVHRELARAVEHPDAVGTGVDLQRLDQILSETVEALRSDPENPRQVWNLVIQESGQKKFERTRGLMEKLFFVRARPIEGDAFESRDG